MRNDKMTQGIIDFRNEPFYFIEEHTSCVGYYYEYMCRETHKLTRFYVYWEHEIWDLLQEEADEEQLQIQEFINKLLANNQIKKENTTYRQMGYGPRFSNTFKQFIANYIINNHDKENEQALGIGEKLYVFTQ